jgi:hypothetical protein
MDGGPQVTQTTKITRCPNCAAIVPLRAKKCVGCDMDVSQMEAFAAAKEQARRRGKRGTAVEDLPPPWWRSPLGITALVLVGMIGAFIVWRMTRPLPPPAWTYFPTSQDALVNQMFTDISVGDDPGYDKAYALISPSQKDPNDANEKGHYRQLFHEVYKYLLIYDTGWGQDMKIERNPGDADTMLVHVGPETLHVHTEMITPMDKVNDSNKHYGATGINEFDIGEAGGMSSTEAQKAVIREFAGQGAVNNIEGIMGASGGHPHETPMQTKMRLIPSLLNPRVVNNYEIYQTWTIRKDPATRWVLERIKQDGRYSGDAQKIAQEVLEDSVTEEERIAAHVPD